MREFSNIRENRLGGFDADIDLNGEVVPYTLTQEDIDSADLSGATMLPQEFKDAYVAAQDLAAEQAWIEAEMVAADKEVKKFDDGHTRPKGANVQEWRTYRNALRDYIQAGVIVGERPVSP